MNMLQIVYSSLFYLSLIYSTNEKWTPHDPSREGCTAILVGPKASANGNAMTSHAADCLNCDPRMALVPRRSYPPGSQRPVYDGFINKLYPRELSNRAAIYTKLAGMEDKPIIGYVPEVEKTFALWESSYPLINEYGLAMGESTTEANIILASAEKGQLEPRFNNTVKGEAIFTIMQLMQIALERCIDARCAINTMGYHAVTYGFTGEHYGTGEAVTIVDGDSAWLFEICGDGSPVGALWVAQRIPDDHILVVANAMVIQEIDPLDKDHFILSNGLLDKVKSLGLWDGQGKFNWAKSVAGQMTKARYAALRVWRIFSIVAPQLNLLPAQDSFSYPVSVLPIRPISNGELMNLFRDHYEGTIYDSTKGVMAGPYGNPNYELTGIDLSHVPGENARSFSILRTSYTQVVESGKYAKVWFAPDAAASSVFVPFYVDTLKLVPTVDFITNNTIHSLLPIYSDLYGRVEGPKLQEFDRWSAYWAFDFVCNWMSVNYYNMSISHVYPYMNKLQDLVLSKSLSIENSLSTLEDDLNNFKTLSTFQTQIQTNITKSWWEFADYLIVLYNDGAYNFPKHSPNKQYLIDYPVDWLRMAGFNKEFYKSSLHWFKPSGLEALSAAQSGIVLTPDTVLYQQSASSPTPTPTPVLTILYLTFIAILLTVSFFIGKSMGIKSIRNKNACNNTCNSNFVWQPDMVYERLSKSPVRSRSYNIA